MKKLYIIFLIFLLVMIAGGCSNSKSYKNGDRVTIDNLIYEYHVPSLDQETQKLAAPYYDYQTADIKATDKPIYHSCYPIDMLHPERFPITENDVSLANWANNTIRYGQTYPIALDETFSTSKTIYNVILDVNEKWNVCKMDNMYVWENSCFWVVGHTDELNLPTSESTIPLNTVTIPALIDGIPVAGIGYGALSEMSAYELRVENLTTYDLGLATFFNNFDAIPFYIMPFGINTSLIDNITVDRMAVVYSRGFDLVGNSSMNFYKTTFVFDASFNEIFMPRGNSPYLEKFPVWHVPNTLYQDSLITINFDHLAFPSSGNNVANLINGVIVNSEYKNFSNAYKVYYNSSDFYGTKVYRVNDGTNYIEDILLSNYQTEGDFTSKVEEITLDLRYLKAHYVSNQEIKSYLSSEGLSNSLKKITLLDALSYNEADKAPYYIDSNNVLYYLATNSLNEEDYIKVFKVPANCEIEVIDNFNTNYYEITSN